MANYIAIYAIVHQPRRLRLPTPPLPKDASVAALERALFDDTINRYYFQKVARNCYHPASELLLELVDRGLRLSIGFSVSFLDQAARWDPLLLDRFSALVGHPNVDLVCVEPYHSFIFLIDIAMFQQRMAWARDHLYRLFGKRPEVAHVTEMFMSREIYTALDRLGFRAALMEGRPQTLGSRPPTSLYTAGGQMVLLPRHKDLSDDVGYRFSQRDWPCFPLTATTYVEWVRGTGGELVFVGWDFETFGEHHSRETGIFEFLRWLPGELQWKGVASLTFSEALDRLASSALPLELPVEPTTWAGLDGDISFFLGNSAQFELFLLMQHAYHIARLSEDQRLLNLALWLCQSDNLHLLQWINSSDRSEAEVSSYFTPGFWWNLGAYSIPGEMRRVYSQFITAAASRLERKRPRPAKRPAAADGQWVPEDGKPDSFAPGGDSTLEALVSAP